MGLKEVRGGDAREHSAHGACCTAHEMLTRQVDGLTRQVEELTHTNAQLREMLQVRSGDVQRAEEALKVAQGERDALAQEMEAALHTWMAPTPRAATPRADVTNESVTMEEHAAVVGQVAAVERENQELWAMLEGLSAQREAELRQTEGLRMRVKCMAVAAGSPASTGKGGGGSPDGGASPSRNHGSNTTSVHSFRSSFPVIPLSAMAAPSACRALPLLLPLLISIFALSLAPQATTAVARKPAVGSGGGGAPVISSSVAASAVKALLLSKEYSQAAPYLQILINTINTVNATVNAPYTLLVPLEALDYCTTIKKYPSQQLLPLMAYHIVKGRFTSTKMAVDPRTEAPPASTLHDSPPSSVLPRPRTGLDFLTGGGFTPTLVTAAPIAPSVCENGKPDSPEHPYPFAEMDAVPLIPFSPVRSPSSTSHPGGSSSSGQPGASASPGEKNPFKSRSPFLPPRFPGKTNYVQHKLSFSKCPSPSSAGNPTTEKDGGESRGAEKTGPRILTLEELQLKAKQQWNRHFPWLIISDTSEGQPCMRCKICMVYADPESLYGARGEGGIDIQKQTMRKHQWSIRHREAKGRLEQREGPQKKQAVISNFGDKSAETRRLIKLLLTVRFLCKSDTPVVMFMTLVQFMAEMGTPDMPAKDQGTYCSTRGKHMIVYATFLRGTVVVTEFFANLSVEKCDAGSLEAVLLTHLAACGLELQRISGMTTDGASVMTGGQTGLVARLRTRALAAKDAAEEFPEFNVVDKVVRAFADILGRSIVQHARFKNPQEVITQTNLEMQGIKDVRWLSRGDAIERFADVLLAAVVLLHEYDKATHTLVTSLKFQFFLFFLVDVLQELNSLNLKFQRRQLDATQVRSMVQNTTLCLTSRYVEYGSTFGNNSGRLATFLKNHGSTENREVKVESIDGVGTPVTHSYVLHEDLIGKEKFGGDLTSCVEAASKFAGRTVFYIDDRMKSLKSSSLRNLFKKKPSHPDTLPGVDWGKAAKDLTSFTTILSTHHEDMSFHDSLSQMLSTPDWESAYPNLGRLWIAVAVLPLSTVECERGFSRQNIIKSWVRGSLCDTTLGDLMTVSLLDYELNIEELVDRFYGSKKRRPAHEVVMAEGSRPVKRRRSHQLKKRAAASEAAAAATRAREEAEEAATRERERAAEEAAWELPTWRKGKNRATIVETSESGSGSDDDSDSSSDDNESSNASESS
ncbi:unnamed protein product [Closterium sp. NIES-54]